MASFNCRLSPLQRELVAGPVALNARQEAVGIGGMTDPQVHKVAARFATPNSLRHHSALQKLAVDLQNFLIQPAKPLL